MEQVTLRAETRTAIGSRTARQMRRQGKVPATVYGRGIVPMSVALSRRDLFAALHTEAGHNALINVEVEGAAAVLTVAREIQRHPVRGDITHLDLIKVSLDVAIEADVSLEYLGTPAGVREGGIVETIENSVVIEALPAAIPSSIPLDISEMEVGDILRIADLPVIDGVTYVDDPDRPLVTILVPRAEEELAEAEGGEGEGAAETHEPGEDDGS